MYIRILLFYIGGVTVIGLLVPSNNPDLLSGSDNAASSPFVIAISTAGIKVLPSVSHPLPSSSRPLIYHFCFVLMQIVNACLLTSAWSAASSDMYTSSRALCASPSFLRSTSYLAHYNSQTVSPSLVMPPPSSGEPPAAVFHGLRSSSRLHSLSSLSWVSVPAPPPSSVGSQT